MKGEVLVDWLSMALGRLQMETIKLLRKNKPIEEKIQQLGISLLSFKVDSLKCMAKAHRQEECHIVKAELQTAEQKLRKYELHTLLKRKIQHINRESMMHSISVDSLQPPDNPLLSKLHNSLFLIEKDLGIEQPDLHDHTITSIVHRSFASIDATLIHHNQSMVSDSSMWIQNSGMENQCQNPATERMQKDVQKSTKKQKKEQGKGQSWKAKVEKKRKKVKVEKEKVLENLLEETYQSCLDK